MKVQLEKGVWLLDCVFRGGDPSRTVVEEYAHEFDTMKEALNALKKVREFHPFRNAEIQDDFV